MHPYGPVINAFIEDTCVLAVIAYLLARGRLLQLLSSTRLDWSRAARLGFILGLVGLTEVVFPGARAPYVTHTLIVTFATLVGGLRVGLIATATVLLGVALLHPAGMIETTLTLCAGALISESVRRLFGKRHHLLRGLTAGMGAQSAIVLLHHLPAGALHAAHTTSYALIGIAANGFGVFLLQFIVNEAQMRADSERNRLEFERAQKLVAEAQLVALRARIHPHFLFNALTSLAALCSLAPDKAEASILRLSQLMRRALAANPAAPLPLKEEIEFVCGYLEIEQHRLGDRLSVSWEIDPASTNMLVPAFALQTLVENAVGHGIAPNMEPGRLRIVMRSRKRHTLVAVLDNGVGMPSQICRDALQAEQAQAHGLQIVTQQLTLLYGESARLRLFSGPDVGTLAAFAVPNRDPQENQP
jgi:hypothetical protein